MAGRLKLAAQVLALMLVTGLFALLVWKLTTQGEGAAPKLGRGETPPAPTFRLDRLDRPGKLSLTAYRGRPVILNFWASWCEPCKEEAPMLQRVWEEGRDDGLVVLGVNAQDFERDARRFVRRYGLTYPIVHDGPGSSLGRFGLTGFPETWWIDREGRLVGYVQGEFTQEQLDANVERALRSS
jgi:cytochrome c biogenesis protein CcmG/thiol:disulfide interchange protein DsbE